MTRADLDDLLDYHYWARDRVLDAAAALSPEQLTRDMGSSFRSVRDTLAHIYGAEWAWHSRWRGTSPASLPSADQFSDVPAIRAAWSQLESQVREVIRNLGADEADRPLEYLSLAGKPGRSTYAQMVQQLVNHASYHRGQITTMFRQIGAAPAAGMDIIQFFRERG
jgi:uncharacterized damage-inducible protein DinB